MNIETANLSNLVELSDLFDQDRLFYSKVSDRKEVRNFFTIE